MEDSKIEKSNETSGKIKGLIGYYNKSVILTYIGVVFSVFGIINIMNGYLACEESLDRTPLALIFLVLAGICDLFDGYIARKCKRSDKEKRFGIQIDSLADIISFVVYPIVILSRMAYRSSMLSIVSVLYVLCGLIRLAYFNITTDDNKGYFKGLPVTFSSLVIPLVYILVKLFNIDLICEVMLVLYSIIAIMFVLDFKLKKPTGVWYIVFSVLAIFTVYGLLMV